MIKALKITLNGYVWALKDMNRKVNRQLTYIFIGNTVESL